MWATFTNNIYILFGEIIAATNEYQGGRLYLASSQNQFPNQSYCRSAIVAHTPRTYNRHENSVEELAMGSETFLWSSLSHEWFVCKPRIQRTISLMMHKRPPLLFFFLQWQYCFVLWPDIKAHVISTLNCDFEITCILGNAFAVNMK